MRNIADAQREDDMPTPDHLRSFVVRFDGQTRPDLIPFALKIEDAVSEYFSLERLESVFTPRDDELTQAFRAEIPAAKRVDAELVDRMYLDLCGRIDELDAETLAVEIQKLDEVQLSRAEARARAFLSALSPAASAAVLAEAQRLGRSIMAANTDVRALAHESPALFKSRMRERCRALAARARSTGQRESIGAATASASEPTGDSE